MKESMLKRFCATFVILLCMLWLSGEAFTDESLIRVTAGNGSDSGPQSGTYSITQTLLSSATFPNFRFGVSAWGHHLSDYDLISNFGVGLYQDFGARSTTVAQMDGAEHIQMLRLSQSRPNDPADPNDPIITCGPDYGYSLSFDLDDEPGGLGPLVAARPGALWIVGNEPDRRLVQDDICPQQYAEAYHDVYHFIKQRDPSAQIAVAGLVEITPGRLQYLDIVLDTYIQKYGSAMPVDVWTMHIYIISESSQGDAHIAVGTDPELAIPLSFECDDPDSYCYAEHDDIDIFIKQIRMMRQWMKDRGYQNTPLLLTEFGVLLPYHYYGTCEDKFCPSNPPPDYGCFCDTNGETFHPQRVADFAEATLDYLLSAKDQDLGYPFDNHRLIQQFVWFSVYTDGSGGASNLLEETEMSYLLTVVGQRWNNYVTNLSEEINLLPGRVPFVTGHSPNGVNPITVTLSAEVFNNGNSVTKEPITVTFYEDENMSRVIGSATFSDLRGAARKSEVVTTTWANLATGKHEFWVKVDDKDIVSELDELDNVNSGFVLVNPTEIYLPSIISRRRR